MGKLIPSPAPPPELADLVGLHLFCRFTNGWFHELYVKSATLVDYRIHAGLFANRWGRGQQAELARLNETTFHLLWEEPTGVTVALALEPEARRLHAVFALPRWVADAPQSVVCYQSERLREMQRLARRGPVYPRQFLSLHGTIPFLAQRGPDDQTVIECDVDELPPGYAAQRNEPPAPQSRIP